MNPLSSIIKPSSELVLDLLKDIKSGLVLKDGQVVEAKVLSLLSEGKAQLLIGNKTVDVKSHVPLSEGDTLYLKVTKSGDSQVLKLVEAHTPVVRHPGLAEVRAMGQEGPYEALAKVINTPLKEQTQAAGTTQPPPLGAKQGQPVPDLPLPSAEPKGAFQTPRPAAASAQAEPTAFTTFVKKASIPLELKVALLITGKTPDMPNVPKALANDLNARLETLVKQTGDQPAQGNESKVPQPVPTESKSPVQVLINRTQALLNTLAPQDKAMVEQALQDRSQTPAGKLAILLKPDSDSMSRGKGLTDIKEALVKLVFPKGIPAETQPLLQFKLQAPAQPAPVPGTDSSVFGTRSMFENLKALITTMALTPETPFNAETLRNLVRNSGLLWERKLRTVVESQLAGKSPASLKEQLVTLLRQDVKALSMNAHESAKPDMEKTVETLKRFVDNVEKLQVLNSHGSEESGRYLLPLPFYSGDKLKFGQLFIDTDKKRKSDKPDGNRIIRVAFLLDMSLLGHVEADFSIFKKALSGEFVVGNPSVKTLLDEAFPGFRTALTRKGYTVSRMECRLEDPAVLSGHSLTDRMAGPGDSAVNIVI